jgi:excisionase family DNA binding protein
MQNTSAIPFSQRISCTITEASQVTGLGRTKIYEAISDGRLESVKLDNRRLVVVASLLRLFGSTVGESNVSAGVTSNPLLTGYGKKGFGERFFYTSSRDDESDEL